MGDKSAISPTPRRSNRPASPVTLTTTFLKLYAHFQLFLTLPLESFIASSIARNLLAKGDSAAGMSRHVESAGA